ncbi:MAG: BMP family lipoprotein [Pseudonocardia sp.]
MQIRQPRGRQARIRSAGIGLARIGQARTRRGIALAAIVLAGAALVSCARDTGAAPGGAAGGTTECTRNAPPAAAGGGAATRTVPNADASGLKVGLAYDIGGRGDQSFNDSAAAGLERAIAELGLPQANTRELAAAPNESEDAAATRLRQLVADGFDPIIAVGFKYATAVQTVAAENPNVRFGIVDDSTVELPNVTPLVFAEEQGSFLVGAAAALKTQTCKIGFVGGVETPLIEKFEAGYVAGAKAVAPNIEVDVKYLTPAGDFTGFNDPAKATVVARGQLDAGADVIYHASGASGQGVFEAVNTAQKQAIGVDSDQYNTVAAPVNQVIITSMLKRVDTAVFSYVNAVAAGDTSTLPPAFDLSVDGVGYATSGGKVDDIVPQLDAYRSAIVGGGITVPTTS